MADPLTLHFVAPTMDVGPKHPAGRAVHAVFDVTETADEMLRDPDLAGDGHAAARQIVTLLADVPADIAALYQYSLRLEEDLRGLRDQGLEDAREISRLRQMVEALSAAPVGLPPTPNDGNGARAHSPTAPASTPNEPRYHIAAGE